MRVRDLGRPVHRSPGVRHYFTDSGLHVPWWTGHSCDLETGFDAWTGLPHGSTIEYRQTPFSLARAPHTDDVPVELRDRRAIPLPVGFAVGVAVVLVVAEQRRTRVRP